MPFVFTLTPYSRRPYPAVVCLVLLLAAACAGWPPRACRAQETPPPPPQPQQPRPRVGLALGGGAARGLAHVGVLEWLEENRIPVDYIAGTSMGGLVAGVYASGMSAPEIRAYLSRVDWFDTFAGEPPYEVRNIRRKQDRREYPSSLELGLRSGVQLPGGLDPAHPVGLLISRAVFPAGPVTDFSQLPIPFRCVAADLRRGDEVVMGGGSLVTALRATMALPGLFTPVEREGRLLVDGGVLNNVPADVVRAMGADVVIAVDVGLPLDPEAKIGSVISVLLRVADVLTAVKNQRGIQSADILIRPDLSPFTLQDWYDMEPMATRGRAAMAERAADLLPLALDPVAWQEHLAARRARVRFPALMPPGAASPNSSSSEAPPPPFAPSVVTVAGASPPDAARALARRFRTLTGEPLRLETLEDRLTDVTGEGRFASIAYEATEGPEGALGLRLLAQNKPYGPPFANFLLNINNEDGGRFSTTLASRVTLLDDGSRGNEVRLDVGLGDNTLLSGEYLLPLASRRADAAPTLFVAPRLFLRRSFQSLYREGKRVADYRVTQGGAGVDVGLLIGRTDEVRAGFEQTRLKASTLVGESTPGESSSGSYQALRLRWEHDDQDDAVLPRRGLLFQGEVRRVLRAPTVDGAFDQAEASATYCVPLGRRDSLLLRAAGGATSGEGPSTALEFTLGGILRLGALNPGALRGSEYAYGAFGLIHRLDTGGAPLSPRVAAGMWVEAGRISGSRTGGRGGALANLSGGLLVDTRYLGPVFLGGSIGGGDRSLQIAVGQVFR